MVRNVTLFRWLDTAHFFGDGFGLVKFHYSNSIILSKCTNVIYLALFMTSNYNRLLLENLKIHLPIHTCINHALNHFDPKKQA